MFSSFQLKKKKNKKNIEIGVHFKKRKSFSINV